MIPEAEGINLGTILGNVLEFDEQRMERNFSDFKRKIAEPSGLLYPEPENEQIYSSDEEEKDEKNFDESISKSLARRKVSWTKFLNEKNAKDLNKRLKELAQYGEVSGDFVHSILMSRDIGLERTRLLIDAFSETEMLNSPWYAMARKARAVAYDGIEKTERDGRSYYYKKP